MAEPNSGAPINKKRKRPAKEGKKISAQPKQASPGEDSKVDFPIVGIGASAGGLEAFEQFFSAMPPDSGMAFVLVQHLDPSHKSILSDLLARFTRMRVTEVKDGMMVEPNKVFVIPPNFYMAIMHGKLHLLEPKEIPGLRTPIDFFFRSLAEDQKEKAICIVLSGTGTEGALGVRAVKGNGGMAMVQDPKSAKYDGMPRHAEATGLVDYVLEPGNMPKHLLSYVRHAIDQPAVTAPSTKEADLLEKVYLLIRAQTGHDFSFYKKNTILRRIDRRMAVHQIAKLKEYVSYLQENPREAEILFKELLIGVTSFYRDKEAFETLREKGITKLLEERSADHALRIWVPGCSTGEEAYSIAMLCLDVRETVRSKSPVQIFATDIDNTAIDYARAGIYPDSIAVDVPQNYLERFFHREDGFFRVKKEIRDILVFASQNVITDPPFSKIDLISCRNLLIYLDTPLQKRVIPIFHYSLNPEGFLFLGTSESIGEFSDQFAIVDRKWKLFRSKGGRSEAPQIGGGVVPTITDRRVEAQMADATRKFRKPSYSELVQSLILKEYSPVGVLVNESHDVVYIHGRTGKYLEPATGEVQWNVLAMAREGLKMELATAIRKAGATRKQVRTSRVTVKTNGEEQTINLVVTPIEEPPVMKGLLMVLFEEVDQEMEAGTAGSPADRSEAAGQPEVQRLEQELQSTKEYLQTTIEELETSNEELKSTNEELQSSNEELQSTNEELETSKEELQSVNEELTTVNTELQQKIEELSKISSDLNNLLASTQIGTIFLDTQLHIQRFTPAVTDFINLIQGDVGRPLAHIVSNLRYENLVSDAREVLRTLVPREMEVQTKENRWYTMRILPYRTVENMIDGVVITFFDITRLKEAEKQSDRNRRQSERAELIFRKMVDVVRNAIVHLDTDGRITFMNSFAQEYFDCREKDAIGRPFTGTVIAGPNARHPSLQELISGIVNAPDSTIEREFEVSCKEGKRIRMMWRFTAIFDDRGDVIGVMGLAREIPESSESRGESEGK